MEDRRTGWWSEGEPRDRGGGWNNDGTRRFVDTNTNTNTKLVVADVSGRGWESDDTKRREGWSEDEMLVGRVRQVERDDIGRRGGWSENAMVGGRAVRMTMESSDMRRREGWSENEMLERAGGRWTAPRQRRAFQSGFLQEEEEEEEEEERVRRLGEQRRWEEEKMLGMLNKEDAGMREEERLLGRLDKTEEGKVNDCWGQRNVSKANANLAKLHQSFGSRKEARCNIRNLFLLNILKL